QRRLARRAPDVGEVVRETLEAFAPLAADRTVTLRLDQPAPLPAIQADPDRLRQVVQNLVENALRYTPPGGEVRIALRDGDGDGIHLIVADTGSGIRAADIPSISAHCHRTDQSR